MKCQGCNYQTRLWGVTYCMLDKCKMVRLHGCHNGIDPVETYQVQDGWTEDGRRVMKTIPATGSKECRYDYKATDSQCNGCKWRD